jgi:hypothetical protein
LNEFSVLQQSPYSCLWEQYSLRKTKSFPEYSASLSLLYDYKYAFF